MLVIFSVAVVIVIKYLMETFILGHNYRDVSLCWTGGNGRVKQFTLWWQERKQREGILEFSWLLPFPFYSTPSL